MTYRSIFVHVDDTEICNQRIDFAVRLAARYPAQLIAAYLPPPAELTSYAARVMSTESKEQYLARIADMRSAAEQSFRSAANGASLGAFDWRAPAGNPIGKAVLHARHADLAVLGQPRNEGDEAFATELANAVVMRCGRPVLFVPSYGTFPTIGECVLIAWKDSRESARAVADALPLLKEAKRVHALAITPDDDTTAHERFTDAELSTFLQRHEIDAKVKRIYAADIAAGELLLSQAADLGADLIVMGAYSRPRLSQLVWGGVTQVMLSSMTVPVLMSH